MNPPDHKVDRRGWRRRAVAAAAIVVGLGLMGSAGAVLWRSAHPPPAYRYVMGSPVAPKDLGPLAPLAEKHVAVREATVVSADGAPLADLELAQSQAGPVLIEWRARVDGPFLKTLPPPQEVADLAPVLKRHMPADGTLLAWWDSSRELRLLAGMKVAFGQHLGVPLFVPARWRGARASIDTIESSFWQPRVDKADHARFQRFVHALLADEHEGMAELRKLAGGRPAVLVLHVRDIILLGQLAPDKIGVAFRDFPNTGDVHGMVRIAYHWLNEHGYSAYAVMRPDKKRVRVIALTDKASGHTLAARLLPFIGNDESAVPGTTLVYKTGGFWVYELTPDAAKLASRKD